MKKRKVAGSSMIFLLELMLAVFIFAVASAVCVQIFVKAKLLSDQAKSLEQAVSVCSTAAELFSVCDSEEEAEQLLQENWAECTQDPSEEMTWNISYENGSYLQKIHLSEADDMLTVEQSYIKTSDGSIVYSLVTDNYLERKRS